MATTWFATSGGAGAQNGQSWATAWAIGSIGAVSAGDTVVLGGGAYSPFNLSKGGNSGANVTYKANVPSLGLGGNTSQVVITSNSANGTGVAISAQWVTFDGGYWSPAQAGPGLPSAWGILINMSNPAGGKGIDFQAANVKIIDIEITGPASNSSTGYSNTTVELHGIHGGSSTLISGCKIHDMDGPSYYTSDHCTFEYCIIYNVSSAFAISAGANPHPDWIFSNAPWTWMVIRYCVMANVVAESLFFNNFSSPRAAGGDFLNLIMYGCVCFMGDTVPNGCVGVLIKTQSDAGAYGAFYFYNNTFVDWNSAILNTDGTFGISNLSTIKNNLFISTHTNLKTGNSQGSSVTINNNGYYNESSGGTDTDTNKITVSSNPVVGPYTPGSNQAPSVQHTNVNSGYSAGGAPLGYDPGPYVNNFKLNATGLASLNRAVSISTVAGNFGVTYDFAVDMNGVRGNLIGAFQSGGTGGGGSLATVVTSAATGLTQTTATLNGSISSNGAQSITADGFDYGLTATYGTHVAATVTQSGAFSVNLTGLVAGTTYHFRATAVNASGTASSVDSTFTTSSGTPPPPGIATVVQHLSTHNNSQVRDLNGVNTNPGSPFRVPLPNLTQVSNFMVLDVTYGSATITSVVDNAPSGSNTWTKRNTVSNAAGTVVSAQYTATCTNAGATLITVTFNTNVVATFDFTEYNNVIGFRTASFNNGSSAPNVTGGVLGALSTDLVHTYGINTSVWNNIPYVETNIVPIGGAVALTANVFLGKFCHYQTAGGSVTAGATVTGGSAAYNCLSLALQTGTQGSPASTTQMIVSSVQSALWSKYSSVSPITSQGTQTAIYPCVGNLLVLVTTFPGSPGSVNAGDFNIVAVTNVHDNINGAWTQLPYVSGYGQIFYKLNATPSANLQVTATLAARPDDGSNSPPTTETTFFFYDCINSTNATLDTTAGTQVSKVNTSSPTSVITNPSQGITPSGAGIVFVVMGNFFGPVESLSNPAQRFDTITYSPLVPGSNNTGGSTAGQKDNDNMSNADGYAHVYVSAAGLVSFQWAMSSVATSEESNAIAFAFRSNIGGGGGGNNPVPDTDVVASHAAFTKNIPRVLRGATANLK